MTSEVLKVATTARTFLLGPFSPKFDVTSILQDRLNIVLPDDAHIRCTNRLHVSVTRVCDGKNVIISEYNSKEELIQALLCSSFIPLFSGIIPPTFRGTRYMDGCYSDNLPVLDENTVTVSPFCGESDICPRDNSFNLLQVNLANTNIEVSTQNLFRMIRVLYPPHPETLSQICKQGFDDALQFLQRNDLIACTRCIALHSTLQLRETRVNAPSSDSDEEIHSHHNEEIVMGESGRLDCKGCILRKEVALLEDLPDAVLLVLEEACASMNRGLINWIFKHKSMRILSVFTLPYVLPIEIAYVICVKLTKLLPRLRQDTAVLVERLIVKLKKVIKNFNTHRHIYSAKFTCQLALTEYDYETDDNFGMKPTPHPSASSHLKCLPPLDDNMSRQASVERVLGRVNVDFTVNLPAKSSKQVCMEAAGPLSFAISADEKERDAVNIANAAFQMEAQKPEDWNTHVDTFDQILEVTKNQDALIAYYYLDKVEGMKVTEIFNVTDADTSALLPVEERESNLNLCWDEDWSSMVRESSMTWLPPTPASDATHETQLDSVLDFSFDNVSILSSEEIRDDAISDDSYYLVGVHVDPSQEEGVHCINRSMKSL